MVSPAAFPGLRAQFDKLLSHTCTLTPVTTGTVDAHYNETSVLGTPVTGMRCLFSTVNTTVRNEGGLVNVSTPILMVSATLAINIGDQISAVTDKLGGTPPGAAGTFIVDKVKESTAGLGASLMPSYELRAADVLRGG
jgi:hypothetical protein